LCYGLEGSYFFLGPRSANFNAASNGVPVLTRPFFDESPPPGESVEQVANPALPGVLPLTGAVNVKLNTLFRSRGGRGHC
jgi:Putative beta barrel porin-7 (BBP7)